MQKFRVVACTNGELARADADLTYSPKEYVLDWVQAQSYVQACKIVRNRKRSGAYPQSAQCLED